MCFSSISRSLCVQPVSVWRGCASASATQHQADLSIHQQRYDERNVEGGHGWIHHKGWISKATCAAITVSCRTKGKHILNRKLNSWMFLVVSLFYKYMLMEYGFFFRHYFWHKNWSYSMSWFVGDHFHAVIFFFLRKKFFWKWKLYSVSKSYFLFHSWVKKKKLSVC